MSLVEHARRELEILGEQPDVIDWYLKVIGSFASFGHSGGSASVTIPTLNALLQFRNLSPLTDNPDEWQYHGEETWGAKGGVWQSRRNAEAFSTDGGKSFYILSECIDQDVKPIHTSESAK